MLKNYYNNWRSVPLNYWRWENFTPKEIACNGTGKILIDHRSLDMLQELRYGIGKPFHLNSAYRSPEHNDAVGGATSSYHLRGMAFDISTENLDRGELVTMAKQIGFKGVGYYNSFIHLDTRNYGKQWYG